MTSSPEANRSEVVGSGAAWDCLAITWTRGYHYPPYVAGVPGCSHGRYNRVSLRRWKKRKKGKICTKMYPANSSTFSVSAAYRQLEWLYSRGTGLWWGFLSLEGRRLGCLVCWIPSLPDILLRLIGFIITTGKEIFGSKRTRWLFRRDFLFNHGAENGVRDAFCCSRIPQPESRDWLRFFYVFRIGGLERNRNVRNQKRIRRDLLNVSPRVSKNISVELFPFNVKKLNRI